MIDLVYKRNSLLSLGGHILSDLITKKSRLKIPKSENHRHQNTRAWCQRQPRRQSIYLYHSISWHGVKVILQQITITQV